MCYTLKCLHMLIQMIQQWNEVKIVIIPIYIYKRKIIILEKLGNLPMIILNSYAARI